MANDNNPIIIIIIKNITVWIREWPKFLECFRWFFRLWRIEMSIDEKNIPTKIHKCKKYKLRFKKPQKLGQIKNTPNSKTHTFHYTLYFAVACHSHIVVAFARVLFRVRVILIPTFPHTNTLSNFIILGNNYINIRQSSNERRRQTNIQKLIPNSRTPKKKKHTFTNHHPFTAAVCIILFIYFFHLNRETNVRKILLKRQNAYCTTILNDCIIKIRAKRI